MKKCHFLLLMPFLVKEMINPTSNFTLVKLHVFPTELYQIYHVFWMYCRLLGTLKLVADLWLCVVLTAANSIDIHQVWYLLICSYCVLSRVEFEDGFLVLRDMTIDVGLEIKKNLKIRKASALFKPQLFHSNPFFRRGGTRKVVRVKISYRVTPLNELY